MPNRLFYDSIELKFIDTREIHRAAVHDRSTRQYLYTDWTFDAVFHYNPQFTSFRTVLGGLAAPLDVAGQLPPLTDIALRHRLMQPRKTLIYQCVNPAGGPDTVLLRTPAVGFSTDAANGPEPLECSVLQTHGVKTWVVHYKIRCRVRECPTGQASSPMALAHTWKVFTDMDQDYFTKRVIEGEVTFDTSRLIFASAYPDDFRREFFHACPLDMKRESVEVSLSDDGARCNYRLVDRETPFMLGLDSKCTRVEGYQTFWWTKIGERAASARGGVALLGAMADPMTILTRGTSLIGPVMGMVAPAVIGTIPQFHEHVLVRAWGHKNSRRLDLMDTAIALAVRRIGPIRATTESEFMVSHQLDGKFVEVNLTHKAGPEVWGGALRARFFGGPGGAMEPIPFARDIFSAEVGGGDGTVEDGGPDLVFHRNPVGSPLPPNHGGTRGTWLGRLITQSLHETCAVPPATPAPTVGAARNSSW